MPAYYPYTFPGNGYPTHFAPQSPPTAFSAPAGTQTPVGFACRPVAARIEAETAQIPFDGSTTYFVDTGSGKIYAKTFDFNTGTAPLVTYVREQPEAEKPKYATLEDLNAFREELDKLRAELTPPPRKVVKKYDPDDE